MDFEKPASFETGKNPISCVPKESAIAKPRTWKIKNGVGNLEGKHLLVFHLLPQNATIKYEGNAFKGPLKIPKPNCDLFISFVSFSFFTKPN